MICIDPLDVIIIDDATISPPKPKMVACIHPAEGLFYRINSKSHWKPCIPLIREPNHLFLRRNSFLECGDPLILDEFVIEDSLSRSGVIGALHVDVCEGILKNLAAARYLKETDKAAIRSVLPV